MKKIFFILCLLGVILPYYHLINFLKENNWSMTGFFDQLYSNHAISMITMDITVAASSFLVYLIYQFLNKKIRGKIKIHAISIWINTELDKIYKRLNVSKNKRPLLNYKNLKKSIKEIYDKRKPIYKKADYTIQIKSDNKKMIVENIIKKL